MEREKTKYVSHLVGIIPIQNGPKNDGFPWPNALAPLYKNYTALHRSVLECAMAGCSSIWVITEKKHIPLLKAVVGNYVEDPVLAQLPVEFKDNFKIKVPIWYASLPVRDIGRRDCYGRSILAGAEYALKLAQRLSVKVTPEKFFVSFPHRVYSAWNLQNLRKKIKDDKKNFYFTLEGKTIKDGAEVGFTFFKEDFERFKLDFKTKDKGAWEHTGNGVKGLYRKPIDQQYPAKRLTLDEVFASATLDDAVLLDCGKNNDISTWEGYAKYIATSKWYRMPKKVKYFKYNKMKNLETRLVDCGDDYDYATQDGTQEN
jgi:hypothetical protein